MKHQPKNETVRIALTGFMGVGKSSVCRHLSQMLHFRKVDLDHVIEASEGRKIAEIIDTDGERRFREIETENLKKVLEDPDARILSLGGGTWTLERNRRLLKEHGFTSIWLESTFEHCWLHIAFSRKDRPLARDKEKAQKLFADRQQVYCLADWHFVIKPEYTSANVASLIVEEIFS